MGYSIHTEFEATLKPGQWQGYNLGPASPQSAFVAAFTPKGAPQAGGFLEKCVIQPEWNGKDWNTVLRLQAPQDAPPAGVKYKVRIYDVSAGSVVTKQTVTLNPGQWQGYNLGQSSKKNALVAAFNPLTPTGDYIETSRIQEEFDGRQWNTVLRLQIPRHAQSMKLDFRVYSVSNAPIATTVSKCVVAGSWPGFGLGKATEDNAFVAALVPTAPSDNGAHVFDVMQPEFDGKSWNSVMRIDLPKPQPNLNLESVVYRISG